MAFRDPELRRWSYRRERSWRCRIAKPIYMAWRPGRRRLENRHRRLTLGGSDGWSQYGLTCDNSSPAKCHRRRPIRHRRCQTNATCSGGCAAAEGISYRDLFPVPGASVSTCAGPRHRSCARPCSGVFAIMRFHDPRRTELTAYPGLISTPEGKRAVAVMSCYCGDLAYANGVLKPRRAFGCTLLDAIQPMPLIMQTLCRLSDPDKRPQTIESTF